jgi:hypothetical protein
MILTLRALAGEQGALARKETAVSRPVWSYNRVPLLVLASLAAALAVLGIGGVGWHVAKGNVAMTLTSLLIATIGIYLFLGILKELANLEFLASHSAKLSRQTKDELLKRMITENSNSVFRLVELLLRTVEKISSEKTKKSSVRNAAHS